MADEVERWRERARRAERLLREHSVAFDEDESQVEGKDQEEDGSQQSDGTSSSSDDDDGSSSEASSSGASSCSVSGASHTSDPDDGDTSSESSYHEEYEQQLADPYSIESAACCTECRLAEYGPDGPNEHAEFSQYYENYRDKNVRHGCHTSCEHDWHRPCALRVLGRFQHALCCTGDQGDKYTYEDVTGDGRIHGIDPQDEDDPRSLVSMLMCGPARARRFGTDGTLPHPAYEPTREHLFDGPDEPECGHCTACLDTIAEGGTINAALRVARRPKLGGRRACTAHYEGRGCELESECPFYHF